MPLHPGRSEMSRCISSLDGERRTCKDSEGMVAQAASLTVAPKIALRDPSLLGPSSESEPSG
eukprot:1948372-Rhodomonas_salina.6